MRREDAEVDVAVQHFKEEPNEEVALVTADGSDGGGSD